MLLADREVLQDQIVQVELHNEQLSQNNDMLRMEVQNLHLEREKVGAGVTGPGQDAGSCSTQVANEAVASAKEGSVRCNKEVSAWKRLNPRFAISVLTLTC